VYYFLMTKYRFDLLRVNLLPELNNFNLCLAQVFEWHGISAAQLMASDNKYFRDSSPSMVALLDGRVYDATEQQYILHKVQSAFFLTVVCSQACHIFR